MIPRKKGHLLCVPIGGMHVLNNMKSRLFAVIEFLIDTYSDVGLDPDREDDTSAQMTSPARNPFAPKTSDAPSSEAVKQTQGMSFTAGASSPHKKATASKVFVKTADRGKQRTKPRPETAEKASRAAQDAATRLQDVIDLTKAQPSHSSQRAFRSGGDVIDLEPEASAAAAPHSSTARGRKSFRTQLHEAIAARERKRLEREKLASEHQQQEAPREAGKASTAGRDEQINSKEASAQQGYFCSFSYPQNPDIHWLSNQECQVLASVHKPLIL